MQTISKRWITTLRGVLFVVIVALPLSAATVAFAQLITINTDDTQLDPNWQSSPLITDSNPATPDDLDMVAAWVADDLVSLYFRIQVAGLSALEPAVEFEPKSVFALLDCDGDGGFEGASDRQVSFTRAGTPMGLLETVAVWPGDGSQAPVSLPDSYGERPANPSGAENNVEWKVDRAALVENCGTSPGPINVRFRTYDEGDTLIEETAVAVWDDPTAVQFLDLQASSAPTALIAGLLGIVALGLFVVVRRRQP